MTATCRNAVTSIRSCARRNLSQARQARTDQRPRMMAYHLRIALQCRADANALATTAR
jgi:hypothetical protein